MFNYFAFPFLTSNFVEFHYSYESKTFESLIFALFTESLLLFALEASAQWDLTGCAKTYSIWSWIFLGYLIYLFICNLTLRINLPIILFTWLLLIY